MGARFYIFLLLSFLLPSPCLQAQENQDPLGSGLAVKSFLGNSAHSDRSERAPRAVPAAGSTILFRVRTVQATGEMVPERSGAGQREIDPSLADLASKFGKLPFKTFRLLASHEEVVPVKKKETFRLLNGDTLAVRPLYIEQNRIGIWIKWQDRNGASILDTRMHFNCGESMLTGTDSIYDGGMILAFNVTPN